MTLYRISKNKRKIYRHILLSQIKLALIVLTPYVYILNCIQIVKIFIKITNSELSNIVGNRMIGILLKC